MIPTNYLTIKEYCEAYECSRKTFYNRVKAGTIPKNAIVILQGQKFIDQKKLK